MRTNRQKMGDVRRSVKAKYPGAALVWVNEANQRVTPNEAELALARGESVRLDAFSGVRRLGFRMVYP